MKAINLTKRTVLTNNLITPKSFLDKSLGLLKFKDSSLLLNTRFGIHTFGLKKPIEVIVLDNEGKVVKLQKSLQPNKVFIWSPIYNRILELPEGSIKKSKTEVGDIIVIHS